MIRRVGLVKASTYSIPAGLLRARRRATGSAWKPSHRRIECLARNDGRHKGAIPVPREDDPIFAHPEALPRLVAAQRLDVEIGLISSQVPQSGDDLVESCLG
jgi:hypothetical protein